MKYLLVQIGDFHYDNNDSNENFKIIFDAIKRLLVSLYGASINKNGMKLILIINGDLSNKGNKESYEQLLCILEKFFTDIKNELKKEFVVLLVPGNHDCDWNNGYKFDSFNEFSEKVLKHNTENRNIQNLKEGLQLFEIDNISIFLLNSAKGDCENGKSCGKKDFIFADGIKNEVIQQIRNNRKKIRILVQHHPYDYYEDKSQRIIENLSKDYFNIVLIAHKHTSDKMSIQKGNKAIPYLQFQCGALINEDGNNQEFKNPNINIIELDIENDSVKSNEFLYIHESGVYQGGEQENDVIKIKQYYDLPIIHDYKEKLLVDYDYGKHDIFEYYVFQKLVKYNVNNDNSQIKTFNDLDKYILKNCSIVIEGEKYSGKTTLAKKIFIKYLEENKQPIYIDLKDLNAKSIKSSLKDSIKTIYGKNIEDYLQLINDEQRMLIIDSVCAENINLYRQLYNEGQQYFKYIITMLRNDKASIVDYKSNVNGYDNRLVLSGFFGENRNELIKQVIKSIYKEEKDINEYTNYIRKVINANTRYIFYDPLFLILLIKYIAKEPINNKIASFEDIYESVFLNHVKSMVEHYDNGVDANKCIEALGFIAEKMCNVNKNFIKYSECIDIIERKFEEIYKKLPVDCNKLVNCLLDANLLLNIENRIFFRSERLMTFFMARELMTDDKYDLMKNMFNNPYSIALGVLESYILLLQVRKYKFGVQKVKELISENFTQYNEEDVHVENDRNINALNIKMMVSDDFETVKKESSKSNDEIGENTEREILKIDSDKFVTKDIVLNNNNSFVKESNLLILLSRFISATRTYITATEKQPLVKLLYDKVIIITEKIFESVKQREEVMNEIMMHENWEMYFETLKYIVILSFVDAIVTNAYSYDIKSILLEYEFNSDIKKIIELEIYIMADDSVIVMNKGLNLYKSTKNEFIKLQIKLMMIKYIGETRNMNEKQFQQIRDTILKDINYSTKDFNIDKNRNNKF